MTHSEHVHHEPGSGGSAARERGGRAGSTDVGAGGVLMGVLVEPSGGGVVHLQQCDAALTPHLLRLVHGQERVKDEAHQAPTHRPGI